ncbi:Tar ligand binding domain-containing protein [Kineococcus rhizosphaerae]|uniref:Chemoreceptor-like protein with four helix bundle sensory module n=1 Tax=Kineococcus rhizosphaerae TaxID=559628 RepID=A0A2T0QR80_9ACTN|nr:MCP four helix bundle domain-containing protein [Kineococcus rhizosphaerae]PRY07341.1 chemoreceptor-like protein with four helix bundle sensory module [Kineococcus rhizosphaerae]
MFARVRDLRVSSKLFARFGIVSILLIIVSVLAISRLGTAQANMDYLSTSGIASVDTIDKVQIAFSVVRSDIADAALTPDAAGTTAAINQLATDQTALDAAWAAYLGTSPASSDTQQAAYTTALADYRTAVQTLIPLAQANDLSGLSPNAPPPPLPPQQKSLTRSLL